MRFALLTAVIAAGWCAVVSAVERTPLPAVELIGRDGGTVQADRTARDGTWIIMYVHAECRSCEAILAVLDGLDVADGLARVMIVVDAKDPVALSQTMSRFPRLGSVQWLADTSGALGKRVAPDVAATILGLRGAMIEWSVTGILTEPVQAKSIVTAWLTK